MIRINLIEAPGPEPEPKAAGAAEAAEAPARVPWKTVPPLAGAVICFGLLGLLYWQANRQISQYNQKIALERQVAARLAGIQAQNNALSAQIAEINQHSNVIHGLEAGRTGPEALMTLLGGAVDHLGGLYLLGVDTQKGRLDIHGQSNHMNFIADFISTLQGMPWFDDVELRQVFEDDQYGAPSFKFELDCVYHPPAAATLPPPPAAPAARPRRPPVR